MAVKLINASIMHIKASTAYKNVWQQKSSEEVRALLADDVDVESLLGEDIRKAVSSDLGIEIPEQVTHGHFQKDDSLIAVLLDHDKPTFFKLTFKKVS